MSCAKRASGSLALSRGASDVCAVRRLRTAAAAAVAWTSLAHRPRHLSAGEEVDEETTWQHAMSGKYGTGNYQLFRPLYKDLCDEIRREYYTKPPPPPPAATGASRATEATESTGAAPADAASAASATDAAAGGAAEATRAEATGASPRAEEARGTVADAPSRPVETYGDGTWTVQHRPADNVIVFHRDAVRASRMGAVHAWARIELKDPPRLNAVLTFADWTPLEVCVERNGVLVHFSMASNEGGMHMRNVRVYAPKTAEERAALLDPSDEGEHARRHLYYDGPCLWHLELDFQNELYDVMQDHGISLDWVRWAASWVFYLEHTNYLRWSVGVLEQLIPSGVRGPEGDFLSPVERELLDEPVEDWLSAHGK